MQRVIDTLNTEIAALKKALPNASPTEPHLNEMRASMQQAIADHELVVRLLSETVSGEVTRYHRLAAVELTGYGEIVKTSPEHWAYKFVEGEDVYGCSNEGLHRIARRLAEFEESGQATAWSIGYSGGFYDAKHGGSRDNPFLHTTNCSDAVVET